MSFIEERFDDDIEIGARRRPRYSTDSVGADGGWLVRNERWAYPLFNFEFNLMPGVVEDYDRLEAIQDMFHVAGGSAGSFLFRDWRDYQGVDQVLGAGDAFGTTGFQLYRNYTRGNLTRRRLITRPDDATIVLRADGLVVPFTHIEKGWIELDSDPGDGAVVAADFDFDLVVHFEDDELDLLSITGELEQPTNIVLEQLRERAYGEE